MIVQESRPGEKSHEPRGGTLRFSVPMCTYQGDRYLPEQLESLASQERLPFELVVFDDRSTDGTLGILQDFAASAPFPVRIAQNEVRLGYVRNFEKAISQSHGDVIALADQDDVWFPDRLARIAAVLEAAPAVGAVFSDGETMDQDSRPLPFRIWDSVGLTPKARRAAARFGLLPRLLLGNCVTGAALAFRANFVDLLLPVPDEYVHDEWFIMCVSSIAPVAAIEDPLIRYRLHPGQAIGLPPPARGLRRFRSDLPSILQVGNARLEGQLSRLNWRGTPLMDRLMTQGFERQSRGVELMLDRWGAHYESRMRIVDGSAGLLSAVAELRKGNYHRYSKGVRSAAKDLAIRFAGFNAHKAEMNSTNPVLAEILSTGQVASPDGDRLPLHSNIPAKEGQLLQRLIADLRPTAAVEVGLAYGVSALFICEALAEVGTKAHYVIDPYQNTEWKGIGLANLRRAGFGDLIRLMELPSHLGLVDLERQGVRVQFAFVDARHTFDHALVDFFHIDAILDVGGVIAFDDSNFAGLHKLCRFIVTNRNYRALYTLNLSSQPIRAMARKSLRRLAGVTAPARRLWMPSLAESDQVLGLDAGARLTVLRKEDEDTRPQSGMPGKPHHFHDF